MPDGKKRPTQQTGSGKFSKRGASNENIPETLAEPPDVENDETNYLEPEPLATVPVPEPIKDIMRTEPMLCLVFIEKYVGETDNSGFYHGEGTAHLKNGMFYTGMFNHGKMHKEGVFTWADGTVFSGNFVENVISGVGTYTWVDGSTYDGEVLNGLRHGHGIFRCADMKMYSGQWKNGKRHGLGILYYDESGLSYYNGDWVENQKCGYGVRRFSSGNMYEGNWKNNIRNGHGTMYWYNNGQEYAGNWVNGIQNGHGEYTWYLKRVSNSQYPLRNRYIGDFVNGERYGCGIFHYSSGAVYDGEWIRNKKHGQGKFTFKNGSVFSGQFHNDHMIDFPDLILPRMMTPDIKESGIPVKSSITVCDDNEFSSISKSVMGITGNAVDAFLDLDLDEIFVDYKYDLEYRQHEVENITRIILRYTTKLKSIYKIYSCLGCNASVDNTFVMFKFQFLRFLKDYNIHRLNYTLAEIEIHLEGVIVMKNCFKEMFIRDFLNNLVSIAYLIFKNDFEENESIISNCFTKLILLIISKEKVTVGGYIFKSINHSQEVYKFADEIIQIYFYFGELYYSSSDIALKLQDVITIYKEMNLIRKNFTTTELVNILTIEERDDEGYYNLDKEMTPFEFLEFVIGSSSIFVTDKIIEKHRPNRIIPMLSLTSVIDETVLYTEEEDEIMRTDASNCFEPVNEDLPEETPLKQSNAENTSISPTKSSKSSGRVNKKETTTQGKKIEKDVSNTNLGKNKKSARKPSSLKMDDGKAKSPKAKTSSLETEVIPSSEVPPVKSLDSNIEQTPSLREDMIVGVDTEITPELDKEIQMTKKPESEKQPKINEKVDNFEIWSLKLNLFLKEYLFPQYNKRKLLEEMVKAQNCKTPNEEIIVNVKDI